MDRLILEIHRHVHESPEYRLLTKGDVLIGRAFDNDIIINDPFIDARHLCLRLTENGLECEDLGSLNGTFLLSEGKDETRTRISQSTLLRSSDAFILGKTYFRVWDPHHQVEAAKPMESKSIASYIKPRKIGISLLITLTSFYLFFCIYFANQFPKAKIQPLQVLTIVSVFLLLIAIWSAGWAAVTRFTKRQHRFDQHFLFSIQMVIFGLFLFSALAYVGFYLCNSLFDYLLISLFLGIFGIFSLNTHLSIATQMNLIKRVMISSGIMVILIGLLAMAYYGKANEFDPDPHHYFRLVPVAKKIIPTISIDEEIRRIDSIFVK